MAQIQEAKSWFWKQETQGLLYLGQQIIITPIRKDMKSALCLGSANRVESDKEVLGQYILKPKSKSNAWNEIWANCPLLKESHGPLPKKAGNPDSRINSVLIKSSEIGFISCKENSPLEI